MNILEITASMVQTLKMRTDAGMYACRDALYLANGDLDLAADILQRQGSLVYYGGTGFDPVWTKAVSLRFNVDKETALKCLLSCGWNVKKIFSYFKEPFPPLSLIQYQWLTGFRIALSTPYTLVNGTYIWNVSDIFQVKIKPLNTIQCTMSVSYGPLHYSIETDMTDRTVFFQKLHDLLSSVESVLLKEEGSYDREHPELKTSILRCDNFLYNTSNKRL